MAPENPDDHPGRARAALANLRHALASAAGPTLAAAEPLAELEAALSGLAAERTGEASGARHPYHALFDNALDGFILLDDDDRIVDVNGPACALFGLSRDALRGQTIRSVVPADQHAFLPDSKRQAQAHGGYVGEFRLERKDGTELILEGRDVADILPGFHLRVMRDVTARRQAQDRLRVRAELTQSFVELGTAYQPLLQRLTIRVAEVLGDACVLRLVAPDGTLRATAWHHRDPASADHLEAVCRHEPLPVDRTPPGRVLLTGEPVLVPVVDPDQLAASLADLAPGSPSYLRRTRVHSLLIVPLRLGQEVIGTLGVTRERPGPGYTEADQTFLEDLAAAAALAINNARLYETAQQELAARRAAEAERARLLDEVGAGRERLQALTLRLLQLQEAERQAVARDLHDEVGQSLTAIKLNLQTLERGVEPPAAARALADSLDAVQAMLHKVRQMSLALRPQLLDDLGLAATLRWYLDRQAQRSGLEVRLEVGELPPRLPPEVEIACFRVVQEALTNVIRHAQARRVRVELQAAAGKLVLAISDDGIGFDTAAALAAAVRGDNLGLMGMQERARLVGGTFEISSAAGIGTRVTAGFELARRAGLAAGDQPG